MERNDIASQLQDVRPYEQIIIHILPEDLQDLFNDLQRTASDFTNALSNKRDNPEDDFLARMAVMKEAELNSKRDLFWIAIHERYNTWKKMIGIRKGYCIVEVKLSGPAVIIL